jgi:hypothetical protein
LHAVSSHSAAVKALKGADAALNAWDTCCCLLPNNPVCRWDVSELCLELLYYVLLRNRDRISSLWPRVYDHCQVGSYAAEQQPWPSKWVCWELSHACLHCTGVQPLQQQSDLHSCVYRTD